MIHQVAQLPRACRLLTDIVALQIAVLEVAAQNPPEIINDDKNIRKSLRAYLAAKRRFSAKQDQPEQVANWIARKRKGLVSHLVAFSQATPDEKSRLVAGVWHDVLLLYRPKAATLKVAVLEGAEEWKRGAKDFLYAFYDLWSDPGFDPYLFSHPLNGMYTRQHFVEEFAEKNPKLYLCAICDSTAYRTRTDARAYTSVEHFFPRSIYPHLSCHPHNLIPICSLCNSYIKGDKDPMQLGGDSISMADLVLPYQSNEGFSKLAYVTLRPRHPIDRRRHPLTVKMKPRQDFDPGKKIDAFNSLYRVEERWDNVLEQIEEQAFRRMCQFFALDLALGTTLTDSEQVRQRLDLLMALTHRDNLGKDPFAFLITWMLKHYVDQLETQGEGAIIYKELKDWAESHSKRWEELKELAEDIHGRVPQ